MSLPFSKATVNGPGIFNVFDRLTHPAQEGLGLIQLRVQWMKHDRF